MSAIAIRITTHARRALMAFPLAAALLFAGADAYAGAMFSGSAHVELQITGITNLTNPGSLTGLTVLGGAELCGCEDPLILEGDGTGSVSHTLSPELVAPGYLPVAMGVGDKLTFDLAGSGATTTVGYADAYLDALGSIYLFNDSTTDSFTVDFTLSYLLTSGASLDDPALDDALGGADVDAYSYNNDLNLYDVSVADALYDDYTGPVSDTVAFSLTLDPGGDDGVDIEVTAGGFAESIPESSSAAALVAGISILGWARRRRRFRVRAD